jgi:hypothetical protein
VLIIGGMPVPVVLVHQIDFQLQTTLFCFFVCVLSHISSVEVILCFLIRSSVGRLDKIGFITPVMWFFKLAEFFK